ncbi:hypothetical protein M3172_13305 [Mesobacillus subterraneus]|uniref:hypothetical protein n=1 Tax=Mesobacillus subterraneus TaxID=285983 RepID=UPI00203BDAFD|nr:hypothetical protein [Mesobacillus subterraneus]MCM3574167.1 hypothetical protein [Mesobacillus subterraneus]
MKKMLTLLCLIFSVGIFLLVSTGLAAPPPTEVEERKKEAPLHLIGTVTADDKFKDISQDEKYPQQIRRMSLRVDRLVKGSEDVKEKTAIEVLYWYIPSWQSNEYIGGERMDIAVGDVIEVWLTGGEYGLEPALGGNTVEHIKYAEIRKEPVPEPFLHQIRRKFSFYSVEYIEEFVLLVLSITLLIIFLLAHKPSKKDK